MLYEDYIAIVSVFREILKATPETTEALKIHFSLIKPFVQSSHDFKRAIIKHMETSHYFPSHIEIKEIIFATNKIKIDAFDVVHENGMEAYNLKLLLNERGANIPVEGSWDWRNRTSEQVDGWIAKAKKEISELNKNLMQNKNNIAIENKKQNLIGE